MSATLKTAIIRHLTELRKLSPEKLLDGRYDKFRAMGVFQTKASGASNPSKASDTRKETPPSASADQGLPDKQASGEHSAPNPG